MLELCVQVEAAKKELDSLMQFMKDHLGSKVERVEVSSRLTDSPCAITVSKQGWSAAQERLMKSQVKSKPKTNRFLI